MGGEYTRNWEGIVDSGAPFSWGGQVWNLARRANARAVDRREKGEREADASGGREKVKAIASLRGIRE